MKRTIAMEDIVRSAPFLLVKHGINALILHSKQRTMCKAEAGDPTGSPEV